jgi:surface protein
MSFSCKKVNSDTNQFELPLINSGTQDFVVDWGDGEQDKITAWDDTAKRHTYYSYGSELVTDGDFPTPNLNWSVVTGWVVSGGSANYDDTTNGQLSQAISLSAGNYKLSFNISNSSGSGARIWIGNSTGNVSYTDGTYEYYTNGNYSLYITVPSNQTTLAFWGNTQGSSFSIDNVSLVEQTPDTTPKTISIDGTIQGWQFNAPGDYLKLNNINRWGALDIHNTAMFYRCGAMTCTATDAPTVSTTSFSSMFRNCTNFNGAIGNWDISSVESLYLAFRFCTVFNKSIDSWDVSNVTNMTQTFYECSSFDQDLNSWDTSNVVSMDRALFNCLQFNGDIYSWDTTNVENMTYMFYNCNSFDQSLAAWNIENVTNLNKIMQNATGLSTSNYNLTLVSWAHQNVNSGLAVDFGGSQYSAGGAAAASRNILTSAPNNWIISDGGSV